MQTADTLGRAGEDEVAHLENIETGGVGDNLIDGVEHVARPTHLTGLAVELHLEMKVLDGLLRRGRTLFGSDDAEVLQLNPLAAESRTVEAFRYLPRQSLGLELALQVAAGEVDAQGHLFVVAVGVALGDALAQSVDFHHQFGLVFHFVAEVGDVEGPVGSQESGVGFQEEGGGGEGLALVVGQGDALHFADAVVQFLIVVGIVHAYADDFHTFLLFF